MLRDSKLFFLAGVHLCILIISMNEYWFLNQMETRSRDTTFFEKNFCCKLIIVLNLFYKQKIQKKPIEILKPVNFFTMHIICKIDMIDIWFFKHISPSTYNQLLKTLAGITKNLNPRFSKTQARFKVKPNVWEIYVLLCLTKVCFAKPRV